MSCIPNEEGVYLLRSYDHRGTIYKIGRSGNIRSRISSYPPNYIALCFMPHKDSVKLENVICRVFNSKYSRVGGKEYFVGGIPESHIMGTFIDSIRSYDNDITSSQLTQDVNEELHLLKRENEELIETARRDRERLQIVDEFRLEYNN
jgi:hypothetical protein